MCTTFRQDLHLYMMFRMSSLYSETKQINYTLISRAQMFKVIGCSSSPGYTLVSQLVSQLPKFCCFGDVVNFVEHMTQVQPQSRQGSGPHVHSSKDLSRRLCAVYEYTPAYPSTTAACFLSSPRETVLDVIIIRYQDYATI